MISKRLLSNSQNEPSKKSEVDYSYFRNFGGVILRIGNYNERDRGKI